MPYTKGLAERALNENLDRLGEGKPDPLNYNIHVAMAQMAMMLEEILARQESQDERLAMIERGLSNLRRRSQGRGLPSSGVTLPPKANGAASN